MINAPKEEWAIGTAYEKYVGRWSRVVGSEFLRWLSAPVGTTWADIGCGSGALTSAVLSSCSPVSVYGIDRSEGFVAEASKLVKDGRASFETGDATALPWEADKFDVTVSGLVLNFVPDHRAMVNEMVRVTKPDGMVAVYVWDYSGGMQMMRYFWDAAISVTPDDRKLDQAERFPICQPEPLFDLFSNAGLSSVAVVPIDIPTVFKDFNDYWMPFLGKQGAAPTYLAGVPNEVKDQIREVLRERLCTSNDGPITLTARAWAIKGTA